MKNIKFEKQDNLYVPGLTLVEGRLATNAKTKLNESQTNTGRKVRYKEHLNENMPADFEAALENSTPENPDMAGAEEFDEADESLTEGRGSGDFILAADYNGKKRYYCFTHDDGDYDTPRIEDARRFETEEEAQAAADEIDPQYYHVENFFNVNESLTEAQEIKHYRCSNCGYEADLTDDEYDGSCPKCHEHHGEFVECDESLTEDTVKQGGKWVNKGKEGTHGEFKTKKDADKQRAAMFAGGYRG